MNGTGVWYAKLAGGKIYVPKCTGVIMPIVL